MALQEDQEFLAHFGKKGMKWGQRKEKAATGKVYRKSIPWSEKTAKQKVAVGGKLVKGIFLHATPGVREAKMAYDINTAHIKGNRKLSKTEKVGNVAVTALLAVGGAISVGTLAMGISKNRENRRLYPERYK